MMPRAIAVPYSPAETWTSTALASVWVSPWMLPPTRITAPTSAKAEPTAAMVAASTPTRASRRASAATAARDAPNARAWSSRPSGSDCTAEAVSAATIGNASTAWARITPLSV